jgi:hypothetical protein
MARRANEGLRQRPCLVKRAPVYLPHDVLFRRRALIGTAFLRATGFAALPFSVVSTMSIGLRRPPHDPRTNSIGAYRSRLFECGQLPSLKWNLSGPRKESTSTIAESAREQSTAGIHRPEGVRRSRPRRLTDRLRKAEIVIDVQKQWLCC